MDEIKEEKFENKRGEKYLAKGTKVKVTGVGYENPDGSGTQTTYKTNYEVEFVEKVEGEKYPYLVEYRGHKRYFKDIKE